MITKESSGASNMQRRIVDLSFNTCKENVGKINMLSHKEIYKHEKSEHKYHTLGYDAM